MALPTFQSLTFQLDTSAASIDVDVSSLGLVEGDALLVLTAEDTNPDGHVVTGNNSGAYTFLHESTSSSPSSIVAWQVQGATPDTSVNVDIVQIRAQGITGLAVKIPSVDTGNPIDAALVNAANATGMPDPPALTTVTAGAIRIITGHLDDDQTPVTAPSGFEQIIYNAVSSAEGGGNTTVMVAFREEATPGTLDPGSFGGSGDDEGWATHFAVNLASVGGGEPDPITGTLAAQETGSDTAAGSGTVAITGSASASETGTDTLVATGSVGSAPSQPSTGTLAAQEVGIDTASGSGAISVAGGVTAQESGADTLTARGRGTAEVPETPRHRVVTVSPQSRIVNVAAQVRIVTVPGQNFVARAI